MAVGTVMEALSRLADLGVVFFYIRLVLAHVNAVQHVVRWWAIVPIIAQETALIVMVLIRRRSFDTTIRPSDWSVAVAGTVMPLWLNVTASGAADIGLAVQLLGLAVSFASLLSLNRSFGIVASNRGVQTSGMYRVMRHPMYVGHQLLLLGYFLASPTVWNAEIVAATIACLHLRVRAEERVLMDDEEYQRYAKRVKRWGVV